MPRTSRKGVPPVGAGDPAPLDAAEIHPRVEEGDGVAPGGKGSATARKINVFRKRPYDAIHRGGGAERPQHAKGKLTARERSDRLLDPGSFTDLGIFALQ